MDIVLNCVGSLCVIIGVLGCLLPVVPGPSLCLLAMVLLQFTSDPPFLWETIWIAVFVTVVVSLLDYLLPIFGTKKFGGTRRGLWGCTIGLVLGLFVFPPFGIIIGPFLGAFLGEISGGHLDDREAMIAAFGSFVGFLFGTVFKLMASGWMGWLFFTNLW